MPRSLRETAHRLCIALLCVFAIGAVRPAVASNADTIKISRPASDQVKFAIAIEGLRQTGSLSQQLAHTDLDFHYQYACSMLLCGAGKVSSGVSPATLTYTGTFATEASGGTTINYGTLAFNQSVTGTVVGVVICVRANVISLISGTLGGQSLNLISGAATATGTMSSTIAYATGVTGTTGALSLTFSGATVRTGVYLYVIGTTTSTPSNSNTATTAVSTAVSASLIVPANGVGLVGYCDQSSTSASFTNATSDASQAMSGATNWFAVGHTTSTGTISITGTGTSANQKNLPMAAWGP